MYKINKNEIETINSCPTCFNKKTNKISEVFYKNKISFFSTNYCKKCSLIFRLKRPKESWFNKKWGLRHNIQKSKSINFLNSKIENDRKKRYALILDDLVKKDQKILDIGCGPGTGLKKYVLNNEVHGIEPDKTRANVAKKNHIKVFNCSLKEFNKKTNNKYDLIIFFHTLEHMFNPKQTLNTINHLLNNKGKLVIEVPNFLDWVSSWHDALYLSHMQNFNLLSFNTLMLKNNFFPTKVFYTKYKNREKNICAIFEKKKLNTKIENDLIKIIKRDLTYKKVKKIYDPGKNKLIKININEINDLSLTYKPSNKIHQNILDNIMERKITFNKFIKKYEVSKNEMVIKKSKLSKNNYKIFYDNECKKINNYLDKVNND